MQHISHDIADLLITQADLFERPEFIEGDPISIPRRFTAKEDIEISAFLAATISWGRRSSIVNSGLELMKRMDMRPYDFLIGATAKEFLPFTSYYYRTFNGEDCLFFMHALRRIYRENGGLERSFQDGSGDLVTGISRFR